MVEALLFDPQSAQLIPDFLNAAYDYQKMAAVTLILCWCSIVSVKFSFLFLFRKLVDRIPTLIKYWWCVTIFNVVAGAYGIAVYLVACPHFYNVEARKFIFAPTFCVWRTHTDVVSSAMYAGIWGSDDDQLLRITDGT